MFRKAAPIMLIMNKLAIDKKYETLFNVFNEQLAHYSIENISSDKPKAKQIVQKIPKNHMRIIFEALMVMNTPESFDLMTKYLEIANESKSELNHSSICVCFLLALQQVNFKSFSSSKYQLVLNEFILLFIE